MTIRVTQVAGTDHLFVVERWDMRTRGWIWAARIRIYLTVEVVRGMLTLGELSTIRTHIPQVRFSSPVTYEVQP